MMEINTTVNYDFLREPNLIESEDVYYGFAPFWIDLHEMHAKFGFHDAIDSMDSETLKMMLKFRLDFLQEELNEAKSAESAEDIVDAMIDLIVVAVGTLDAFNVHTQIAWDEVHFANMNKERGIKPERPNPLGLPDLIKPEGWVAPSHEGNHGLLTSIDYTNFNELFS
jgi:predicted HAD superfamily Cof-like phosphohydrolase